MRISKLLKVCLLLCSFSFATIASEKGGNEGDPTPWIFEEYGNYKPSLAKCDFDKLDSTGEMRVQFCEETLAKQGVRCEEKGAKSRCEIDTSGLDFMDVRLVNLCCKPINN